MCCNREGSDLDQLKQDCIQACQADTAMEEEAKDFKNMVEHDHEPKDRTEATIVDSDPPSAQDTSLPGNHTNNVTSDLKDSMASQATVNF
jgi:hypothetical protein